MTKSQPHPKPAKALKPPEHLTATAKEWWKSVTETYVLEPHHHHLLRLAAEALDRAEQARQELATTGTVFQDRYGSWHPMPQIAIERDSRTAFARLLRELDLDTEMTPAPGTPRPPPLRSNRWK